VGHIANASAQRLKHYNKVLSEQVAELKGEIARVESGFCFEFGAEPRWGINPRKLGALLEENARLLRAEMAEVQRDMRILNDGVATRSWLKRQRELLREADFDFF
jgi:hypothetical protein